MFRTAIAICAAVLVITACGGGGGGSNGGAAPVANNPPAPVAQGGLTLQLGDNALDGLKAVIITISGVILIGEDGQTELTLEEVPTEIDLLALQNLTETLFDGDVPAGDYSKIRLEVDELRVIEADDTSVPVQLPSGKIDLNPQGAFSVLPGEELVIEIDIALDRSIHIVTTGNSRYRFRPVVFVDIIDQSDRPRMTRIFGEVFALEAAEEPFDLCMPMDAEDCYDITVPESLRIIGDDDMAQDSLIAGALYHMFGVYFIDDSGDEERLRFRPILAIQAAEDGIDSIFGEITAVNLPNSFVLTDPVPMDYDVSLSEISLVLNRYGEDESLDENARIRLADSAEVWARTELGAALDALLVIVRPDEDGEGIEGDLVGVVDNRLDLSGDQCVLVDIETEYQLVEVVGDVADSMASSLEAIAALTDPVEIAAFGTEGLECLEATFVVATVEPTE